MNISDDVRQRFFQKVRQDGGPAGDCWVWTGYLRPDLYPGHMVVSGARVRVAHVSLALHGKPRPSPELIALHSCDYASCVNPSHLRWGTELDNIKDAIARRKHGRTFTPEDVRYIRASSERLCDLAREFNTSSSAILNIRKRVSHKHVD